MKTNRILRLSAFAASIALTAVAMTRSNAMAQPAQAPSAQLQQPTVNRDDASQRWIFRVNGQLQGAS